MYRAKPVIMADMSLYNPYVGTSLGGQASSQGLYGGSFGSWLKKTAGKVNKFLKDTKVISSAAGAIATRFPQAQGVAEAARKLGYGKRRRRSQRGGTQMSLKGQGKRKRQKGGCSGGSKSSGRKRRSRR